MTKNHLRGSAVAWENIFHRASGREHQSNRGEQHLCVDFELGHAYDHHKFGRRVSFGTYFRVIFLNIEYSRRPCGRHSLRCFCFWLECRSKNLTFETLHVVCFTFRVREKGIFEPKNLVLPSFAKSTLCTRSRRKCFDSFELPNSKYPILKFVLRVFFGAKLASPFKSTFYDPYITPLNSHLSAKSCETDKIKLIRR